MAFNAGSVKGYAILDSSGWETGANKIDKSNVGITKSIMTAQVALGAIKLAFSAVTSVLKDSINAYIESEKVQSQLNAVLTSTKYAAGMTAKEINNMAASLQSVTTYDDEAIVSGQNLLLTFTKIGKDVFPLATETMLDMSTALGQDLKSSATQLGKALQDPIAGITALSRVGVNFTDTQKNMIKGMVDAGKTMEAQKFILKELQTEFGGSAKAARDTLGGSIVALKNAFGNLQETAVEAFGDDLKNAINSITPIIEKVINNFDVLMKPIRDMAKTVINTISNIGRTMSDVFIKSPVFGYAKDLITNIWEGSKEAFKAIGNIIQGILNLASYISPVLEPVFDLLSGIVKKLTDIFKQFNSEMDKINKNAAMNFDYEALFKKQKKDVGKIKSDIMKMNADSLKTLNLYIGKESNWIRLEKQRLSILQESDKKKNENYLKFIKKYGKDLAKNLGVEKYEDTIEKLKSLDETRRRDYMKYVASLIDADNDFKTAKAALASATINGIKSVNAKEIEELENKLAVFTAIQDAYNARMTQLSSTKTPETTPPGDIKPETEVDWSKYREEYIAWLNELMIKNAVVTKDLRTQTIAFANLGEAIHVTGLAFQSLSDIGSEFYDLGFDFTGTFDLIQNSINDLIDSIKGFKDGINGMDKIAVAVLGSVAATLQTAANIIASVQQRLSASSQAEIDMIKSTYDEKRKIAAENTATEIKTTEGVTQAELDALRDKFDQGIIGYQEYAIHAEELKRNQASKEKIIEKKKSDELLKIDEEEKEALYQANLKQFYTDQGFAIANVWIQAGVGIVSAFAQSIAQLGPIVGAILGGILGTAITGMAVAQTALIATQKPPSRAMGGFASGTTKVNEYGGGEIITLPDGSQVIPNDISKQIANNISNSEDRGMVNNFYFNDTKIMNEDGMQVIANFVIREIGRQARFR